jgi:hypothetical protein
MPSYRRALLSLLGSRNAYALVSFTLGGEALNLSANLVVGFAGLMAPLALVSLVTGLHPLFLLAYGILFTVFFPAPAGSSAPGSISCRRPSRSVSWVAERP